MVGRRNNPCAISKRIGGAGWYFKIYRPKKQQAAESEADYGGEYDGAEDYDETAPEDDGPPWDEDGEE